MSRQQSSITDWSDLWYRQLGYQSSLLSPEYSSGYEEIQVGECWNWRWIIGHIVPISSWFYETPTAYGLVQISLHHFLLSHWIDSGGLLSLPSLTPLVDKQVLLSLASNKETGKTPLQETLDDRPEPAPGICLTRSKVSRQHLTGRCSCDSSDEEGPCLSEPY